MLLPGERVVMVSGANRGIGAAVARRLAAGGFRLSLGVRNGRTPSVPPSERCLVARYEGRDRESPKAWVDATLEQFGRIDALVNNAGISRLSSLEEESEDALDEMWLVNVKAPMRLIRAALPHLRKSGAGRVVNVASLSGKRVKNDNVGYAMTKFALMALTHSVRRLGWQHGIRATAICPSFVATDMTADVTDVGRAEMIPPEDIAELVATVLCLPNNAAVAELLVNMRYEEMV
jgi:NAD(P)-dependent dehydrogenase (short-subunit alcohol dehydrogenase family)